jgi:hypothetical protein
LSKIERIQGPGPAPDLISLMPAVENLKPSQAAKHFKKRVWARKTAGLAAASLAIFLMYYGMGWGFLVLIPASILFFGEVSGAAALHQQRSHAEGIWKNSIESWNRNAGTGKFDEMKGALRRAASSYRALPGLERDRLQALEAGKRDLQIQKHLEAHKVSRASIDGIGDGRKMMLRSFGIETAWDIKPNFVRSVPGFGPVLTKKLADWRRLVEGQFKFNPNIPTDPTEIAKVRAEIAMRRNTMETEFIKGIRDLETMRVEALAKRRDYTQYQSAYLAFRQSEIDTAWGHRRIFPKWHQCIIGTQISDILDRT